LEVIHSSTGFVYASGQVAETYTYVNGKWTTRVASSATVNACGLYGTPNTSTTSIPVSVGTSAQRPVVGFSGSVRFNTTLNAMETWSSVANTWTTMSTVSYPVEYLVIAAGGAASCASGGGAGGALAGFSQVTPGKIYTVAVGSGGSNCGGPSYIALATVTTSSSTALVYTYGGGTGTPVGGGAAARGYIGQGYAACGYLGGGATSSTGSGILSNITGANLIYASGGQTTSGVPSGTNTGNGGSGPSGTGAPGVVYIRYLGSQRATGGTVTTVGTYTLHSFTLTGTYIA
jgi:hypothetical protein